MIRTLESKPIVLRLVLTRTQVRFAKRPSVSSNLKSPTSIQAYLISSLYANFSEGFRSGGFNQSGVGDLAASAGLSGVSDLYKAEESSNFELGIKELYPDISTRFNASLFNTSIDNQHYFCFVGSLGRRY